MASVGEKEVGSGELVTAAGRIQFEDLKPICCAVMKNGSEENFIELDETLDKLSVGSLTPQITNYILFPLVVHLKSINLLKAPVRTALLRCISSTLSKGTVENFKCFMDLFQTFSMILGLKGDKPSVNFNENLAEDLVDQVELALYLVLKNITSEHGDTLFQEPYAKSVGHAIYMQLQILGSGFPFHIRRRAMSVVEVIFNMASNSESKSKCMLNFLPGVVIALRKVASVRQGKFKSELTLQALELLPKVIIVSTAFQSQDLGEADEHLCILLTSLSEELISYEDLRMRQNLSNLSRQIISHSSSDLPKLRDSLWKNILDLCWDEENEIIALPCRQFLTENAESSIFDFDKILENLTAVKSHYLSGNLDETTRNLKYVASALCVMKLSFIEISSLFPPLVTFLTLAIAKNEFDLDKEAEETMFRRNPLLRTCDNLCMSFSLAGNLSDILEEYLPYLSINATADFTQRLENNFLGALYVFNKILLTNLSGDALKGHDLSNVATLYLEILDQQVLDRAKGPSPKVATILEYESILLVVGLGLMCRADSNIMSSTLYYLLEQAGSNDYSEILSRVATNVVDLIAKHHNMNNLEELLVVNLDLILSEVSVRVSSISSYPNCPNALIFLAKYFDFGKGAFTQIISRAFMQSCDKFYASSSQKYFAKIFYAYMTSLWNQRRHLNLDDSSAPILKCQTLSQKLWYYQCSLGICDEILEDQTPQDENAKSTQEDEEQMDAEASLSDELKLVVNICERVLNFLPSHPQDPAVQITSMDSLILGIQLLQRHENALLPLAHKIWLNLSSRFTDSSMMIVKKSFELLVTLCKCSGSFLRKRVVQEVFPKLSSTLMTLAHESSGIEQKNLLYYTHTQSFKLQLSVLEGLAELCLSIELSEEELDQVVSSCLMYVKPKQHKKLREAAIKVVDNFAKDPHASSVIWTNLIAHGLRDLPAVQPHPDFIPVHSTLNSS